LVVAGASVGRHRDVFGVTFFSVTRQILEREDVENPDTSEAGGILTLETGSCASPGLLTNPDRICTGRMPQPVVGRRLACKPSWQCREPRRKPRGGCMGGWCGDQGRCCSAYDSSVANHLAGWLGCKLPKDDQSRLTLTPAPANQHHAAAGANLTPWFL